MQPTQTENVKLTLENDADFELFASYIKDAMVERVRLRERFSAIRLESTKLVHNEFLHKSLLGQARHADNTIVVSEKGRGALSLADTVIHELGHILVGPENGHGENWIDACKNMLGLVNPTRVAASEVKWDDFDEHTQRVVREAIERFVKDHPKLVTSAEMEIPWPASIGLWTCEKEHESFHPCYNDDGSLCHRAHVLEFQDAGIREMLGRSGNVLLADEMGLGKTVQVIGYINATHPKRIFVGCPNNAKLIWKRHFEDWCVHNYDLEVAYTKLYTWADVTIMNYEAMVRYGDVLKQRGDDLIIYDEGHYLKTPSAKRSKVAYSLGAAKKIIVTGSPIVNYPFEVFPLAHYLDRNNFPEIGRFEAQFGTRNGDQRLGRNLNRLNSLLRATIMTRRLKKDVMAQLPRKRRQVVEFVVPDEQKKLIEEELELYEQVTHGNDAAEATFLNAMRNDSDVAIDDAEWAKIIEELRFTKSIAFSKMARLAHLIGLAKVPFAIEFIENAVEAREKVLVFGHHRDVLQEIAKRFAPGSVLLLGGNTDQALATQQASDRFNNDDTCVVMCAQISNAQGYSIKGASTVIFVEEDWVPGIMTQAEDRLHGIGRGEEGAKSLMIYHLVFEDSLDTKKAQLTIRKQKSIDRAVGTVPKQ
jgi:Superfamily II DNA/RNA helicases, SNF2 family